MKKARGVALEGIYKINEEGGFSNIIVNNLLNESGLDKRDRALVTQLIYGSLRRKNTVDWIIDHFASPKVKKMTPWARTAIRLGVYQIKYMDKIPSPVACNETVEVAKRHCNRGAIKFINGVLRNIVRKIDGIKYPDIEKDPVQHIRYKYSYPQWLAERWVKEYGLQKAIEIATQLNQIPKTVIRANTLKVNREELLDNLREDGATSERIENLAEALNLISYSSIGRLKDFDEGNFQVQGLASMMVSHIVNPSQDDLVIDLCSAPGGKTTHLAQLMNNKGKIYAVDLHQHKLKLLRENCQRLGIYNVKTFCGDGREVEFEEKADKILVDAPCSGLGIMGKKPEIRWKKKPQDLNSLQELQLELLANATKLVKEGGEIVYSTCTFTKEENSGVIEKFLARFNHFSLVSLEKEAEELGVDQYLQGGQLQLLPDSDLIEGFFIAKLRKNV